MTGTSVDLAVRLVRQAVHQDSKKNYTEAARCYREAILILQQLKTSRTSSCRRMQNFLNTKLVQYEERLRIIEHHLLQKSDLSKFFKELQSCHFDDCGSSVSSDTKHLYKNPLLVKALDLIRRGRKEDERSNYRAAGTCYEAGHSSLLDILNKGVLTEKQADTCPGHSQGAAGGTRRHEQGLLLSDGSSGLLLVLVILSLSSPRQRAGCMWRTFLYFL